MRNRFNLSESEKNYIRGLHGIRVITEQDDDLDYSKLIGKGCTEEELALGLEPIPGGGCGCPPNKFMENGKCVQGADDTADDVDDEEIIDDEMTDVELEDVENPEDEDSWLKERWEDLTDAVRNIFTKTRRFKRCRGKTSCAAWNRVDRNRKRRILRRISYSFPRIKWPRIKLFAKK